MFTYNFIQNPTFKFSPNIIDDIFENISKDISIAQNWVINLVFFSPEEIRELNKKYRKKDIATDVLSFHYYEDFSKIGNNDIAGDLIFCEEYIILQWEDYWLGTEKEFYKLLIHSLLHILWFDHEKESDYKEMKKWEDKIWKNNF